MLSRTGRSPVIYESLRFRRRSIFKRENRKWVHRRQRHHWTSSGEQQKQQEWQPASERWGRLNSQSSNRSRQTTPRTTNYGAYLTLSGCPPMGNWQTSVELRMGRLFHYHYRYRTFSRRIFPKTYGGTHCVGAVPQQRKFPYFLFANDRGRGDAKHSTDDAVDVDASTAVPPPPHHPPVTTPTDRLPSICLMLEEGNIHSRSSVEVGTIGWIGYCVFGREAIWSALKRKTNFPTRKCANK